MLLYTKRSVFQVNSGNGLIFCLLWKLLQNAAYIMTKCGSYIISQFDKRLLQNATVITKCIDFIEKYDSC